MGWYRLCREDDIAEGSVRSFVCLAGRVGVARHRGKLYSFADQCSHDDSPLCTGMLEGEEIECPAHQARFSIKTGQAMCMPATEAIEVYPVRIVDGHIEVEINV